MIHNVPSTFFFQPPCYFCYFSNLLFSFELYVNRELHCENSVSHTEQRGQGLTHNFLAK